MPPRRTDSVAPPGNTATVAEAVEAIEIAWMLLRDLDLARLRQEVAHERRVAVSAGLPNNPELFRTELLLDAAAYFHGVVARLRRRG